MAEIIKMAPPILFSITGKELEWAEAHSLLPPGFDIEYWWDAADCTHPGYPALRAYASRRQKGRLVRLILADGTLDPDEIFVHWINVPDGCGIQFQKIEYTNDDPYFVRERKGHGCFIQLKRDDGFPPSKPENFFLNWGDFPQLHEARVLFFEGIPESWRQAKFFA